MNFADRNGNVLAIDIGNTMIRIAVVDLESLSCSSLKAVPYKEYPDFLATVRSLKHTHDIHHASVSAVNRKAGDSTIEALTELQWVPVLRVKFHDKLPLHFNYVNKDRLGADRIADCLYAHHVNPKGSSIIIDAGTAITIDLIRNATFSGGVILPGPGTQYRSLSESTDALPFINDLDSPVSLPGLSTEECIRAGIIYGIAGGIDRIVREMLTLTGNPCTVFATGGAWSSLVERVGIQFNWVKDLTLFGTALYTE